jgi:hypothetical protein
MLTASQLQNFYGTDNWYKHRLSGLAYTDGIKFIADNGGNGNGAYWLIDAIGSYQHQPKVKREEFQIWTLKVQGKSAVLTMQSDSDQPAIVRQEIEYTDFELPELVLYVENNVLCLPLER